MESVPPSDSSYGITGGYETAAGDDAGSDEVSPEAGANYVGGSWGGLLSANSLGVYPSDVRG